MPPKGHSSSSHSSGSSRSFSGSRSSSGSFSRSSSRPSSHSYSSHSSSSSASSGRSFGSSSSGRPSSHSGTSHTGSAPKTGMASQSRHGPRPRINQPIGLLYQPAGDRFIITPGGMTMCIIRSPGQTAAPVCIMSAAIMMKSAAVTTVLLSRKTGDTKMYAATVHTVSRIPSSQWKAIHRCRKNLPVLTAAV